MKRPRGKLTYANVISTLALILGLLSALAAFGLFVICLFAFRLDAIKRIDGWQP